jgi:hypothetical protein
MHLCYQAAWPNDSPRRRPLDTEELAAIDLGDPTGYVEGYAHSEFASHSTAQRD